MGHFSYRIVGLLVWVAALVVGYASMRRASDVATAAPTTQWTDFLLSRRVTLDAVDPAGRLRASDPVFERLADGTWTQIGHVEALPRDVGEPIRMAWYAAGRSPDRYRFIQHRNRGSLDEVVATMLPREKRMQIQNRLAEVVKQHGEELSAAFVPLVQESLQQSIPVVEEEFRLAVDRHRAEVDQLAARWNDEVVSERLIPLAQREIVPIVRTHGEPTAERIGRELWDRASLWRFGWRIAYDRSPLPQRNLAQEEWERFVEEEALPTFEEHMDEVVTSVQRIVGDVAANPTVRRELADVAAKIASDPDARQLVRQILKETLVENDQLRETWRNVWTSDDAQHALKIAGDRLEPIVRSIGDDLFGTEETGIDPNFARVLRNQILGKDRRWIVASPLPPQAEPISLHQIELADHRMPYPVVYLADRTDAEASEE